MLLVSVYIVYALKLLSSYLVLLCHSLSGEVSEGEMESAEQEKESSSFTEFKGGSHFYEEVNMMLF